MVCYGLDVGRKDEEDVPRELMASRVREAALCFDNTENANKNELMKPRTETEVVAPGRKAGETLLRSKAMEGRAGKRWVVSTLSGWEVGKWCSFSHLGTVLTRLFPRFSTQVVDFPHLAMVRLFSEGARIGFPGPNREVTI